MYEYLQIYLLTVSANSSDTDATMLLPYEVRSQLNGSSRYLRASLFFADITTLFSLLLKSPFLQLLSMADCAIAISITSVFVISFTSFIRIHSRGLELRF